MKMGRKPINRLLAMFLVLALFVIMTACQKTQTSAPTTGATTTQGTTSTAPTTTEAPSNFNPTGYPIVNEKITISVTGARSSFCPSWQDTIMVQEIEEMFNIIFDCQEFSGEEWAVQKGLLFASGSLPDLFVAANFSLSEVADYGAQGFLAPMNDLIAEYGEHTKVVFAKNADMERLCTSPDGNIYTLVEGSAIPANLANRNWINEVWIENVGLTYPKTLDELYTVLKAFKDQDANGNGDPNDEIPASGRILDEIVLNALGFPLRSYAGLSFYLKDGEPEPICTNDLYKVYLKYMRTYYADGLLDSTTFIQTAQELQAKMAQGRVGAYQVAAPWLYESAETAFDYRYFGGLTSEYNATPIVGASNGLVASGRVAISSKNENPEATFRLLDYFYSDEGSTFGFIGSENVGWKWEDQATGAWSRVIPSDWKDTDEAYRNGVLIINGWNIYRDTGWKLFAPTGNNIWLFDQYTDYAVPYLKDIFPTVVFTEDEQKQNSTLTTDLTSYINDTTVRFILGEIDIDSGWDNFQKTLTDMGINDLIANYAAAYDRFMGR
jgi:putative aldouronate transport system substrate-binding protein